MLFSDKHPIAGDIVDVDGNVLGRHKGIEFYTIGQRRGLSVSSSVPLYVSEIDAKRNRIVLGTNDSLLADGLYASNWVWPNNLRLKIILCKRKNSACNTSGSCINRTLH